MNEDEASPKPTKDIVLDNQIKLYVLLVDQLQRYNTIVWQVPTALVTVNLFVVAQLANQSGQPWWLLAMSVFDASMVFGFWKIVDRQSALIEATQSAEASLRRVSEMADFTPAFKESRPSARHVARWVLVGLNVSLVIYVLVRLL